MRRTAAIAVMMGLLGCSLAARGEDGGDLPRAASDLFQPLKVWSLHLRFAPEQWAAMEPAGGTNPFDMSAFGMGMFLLPAVMREGDRDGGGTLTREEFRGLAERWFAAWDRDADGSLDSKGLREGLKATLAPGSGGPDGGGPPAGFSLQGREGQRNGLSSILGIEFAHVRADLEFEGRAFPDVAVRYKGNGTFLESRSSLKRSLKVDLNKFVKGRKLAGVATLNLHNNVTDAGMMSEVLAYRLYRDAGVPAPRTAYARVFVTVPGKHDRKYFGLYSLVENVDKDFVADRGLGKGGAILKPSSPDLFADLGDDWAAYKQTYDPKTDLTTAQERRVIAFCRLVSKGSDAEFAAQLGDYVDLDEFARFLAVSAWIGDLDSILTNGQNFYLYLDPRSGRFQFIPWDKDHTFGSWIAGSREDREQHSIREPWEGRKRFLERAFRVEAFRSRYLTAMGQFAEEFARPERIEGLLTEIATAIRPAVKEESAQKLTRFEAVVAGKALPGGLFGLGQPTQTLLPFVKARAASVWDQLAGKSEGRVLGKRRPGEPQRPEFRPEEAIEAALLRALDTDRDKSLSHDEFVSGFDAWFAAWDTEKKESLTDQQVRKGLNRALPFPFPFGAPRADDAKPPGGGPPTTEAGPRDR